MVRVHRAARGRGLPYWSSRSWPGPEAARPLRPRWDQAASKQGTCGSARHADERPRIEEEQDVEKATNRKHHSELIGHVVKAFGGFVEIHNLDDRQIIIGSDHAGEYADDRK